MLKLALLSLLNRRFTFALTVIAIAISVGLILGIERLRAEARESFTNTASGIDLIVASRGNNLQILLATVFGVGSTSNALRWDTFEMLQALPEVAWALPVSQGDNHKGFPVIGTTADYFERFRHSGGVPLAFAQGTAFDDHDGAVVGAEVAASLGYAPGTEIVNAHGAGDVSFDVHDEAPFTVTGVLARSGTPVDRMVFVSLEGFDAIHAEQNRAARPADPFADAPTRRPDAPPEPDAGDGAADRAEDGHGHEPEQINAVFLGLRSKSAVLSLQRRVADYTAEPLSAVLPAATLLELWSLTAVAENTLRAVALAVVVAGLLGMVTMVSSTLDARRREFAILRSVGASPGRIFGLIVLEAGVITLAGMLGGVALLYLGMAAADPVLTDRFGLRVGLGLPSAREWLILVLVGVAGLLASLFPAYRVYRTTLSDGLTLRL